MLFDTLRKKNQAEQEEREWNANRPADYVSRNKDAMDSLTGQIGTGFDWDTGSKAYQQYRAQAQANAAASAENAQANAAAQTGGYSSSYGTQAGQNAYTATMNNLDNVLNSLQDQSRSEYTAKRTGLESRLSGLQNAEQQDYQNYQKDMANWMDGLQYRQNEYDKASSESSQRTSRWLNGILSAVQLAAQILPFFFV